MKEENVEKIESFAASIWH